MPAADQAHQTRSAHLWISETPVDNSAPPDAKKGAGGVSDDPVADMGIAGGAAAVKLGPPKFGHAIHIVNSLLRAETELPAAKPFDFSPFVKF